MTHASPGTAPEILIVGDSQGQAGMLRHTLEAAAYRVSMAKNGEKALRAARAHPPALVLIDIVIPLINGYQLCREIKCDEVLWRVPVILLTKLAELEDIVAAINNGADGYIPKPPVEAVLLERISATLATPIRRKWPVELRMVEFQYKGVSHTIHGASQQVLNLMFSLNDIALSQQRNLESAQSELERMNKSLTDEIIKRTAALAIVVADARHATERLRILFEHNSDGVVVVDPEGLVLTANPAASRLFEVAQRKRVEQEIRDLNANLELRIAERTADLDQANIKQIVYNLLSNAIKFTPEDGTVTLSAHRCGRAEVAFDEAMPARLLPLPTGDDGEFLEIAVDDSGVGIIEANLQKLYEPFTQVDSSVSRNHAGTGLGLALVRRLAELHGGTVGVASCPGAGSRFCVWLPYRATDASSSATGRTVASSALHMRSSN